jgi:tryptophanase
MKNDTMENLRTLRNFLTIMQEDGVFDWMTDDGASGYDRAQWHKMWRALCETEEETRSYETLERVRRLVAGWEFVLKNRNGTTCDDTLRLLQCVKEVKSVLD